MKEMNANRGNLNEEMLGIERSRNKNEWKIIRNMYLQLISQYF